MKTNMGPYVYLTRSILPSMLKREKRSGIIFTSSIGANYTIPGMATYAASKTFNDSFGRSLAYEVYEKVDVLSFKPAHVNTKMNPNALSFSVLSPEEAVHGALDKLGWDI